MPSATKGEVGLPAKNILIWGENLEKSVGSVFERLFAGSRLEDRGEKDNVGVICVEELKCDWRGFFDDLADFHKKLFIKVGARSDPEHLN